MRLSHSYKRDPAWRQFYVDSQAQRSSSGSVATIDREIFHQSKNLQTRSRYGMYETDQFSEKSRSNKEDSASLETPPSTEPSFEERKIPTSRSRSEEASRRRRLERNITEGGSHWKVKASPQAIRPSDDDEIVMVTEPYVYRPQHLPHIQSEAPKDRGQNFRDKTAAVRERPYQQFAAKSDASDYYKNDWAQVGEQDRIVRQRMRPRHFEEPTAPDESHTSEASSSSHYGGKMPTWITKRQKF